MIHLRRYLAALFTLGAAFCAYAYGLAPLVEPPPATRSPAAGDGKPVAVSPQLRVDLARLFEAPAWELDDPIVVEAEQCTLLVQEYLPTPDGRLELKPCTVIFYAKGAASGDGASPDSRRPVVMQAPEGAVLQFDRPLDIARGQFGRVIGGRLNGAITVYSPPSVAGGNDGLHFTTRNVQLDQNKVFTPHEVQFRYGDTYGKGRDLTIILAADDPGAVGPPKSSGNIQSLTLARIDRLHIVPPPPDMQASPALGSRAPAADEAPVEVTCQGPFVLDMAQQVATFDDRVEVVRLAPQGPPDRLRCDRLLIELIARQSSVHDRISSEAAPLKPAPRQQPNEVQAAGRVERVIAIGAPATLDAPSRGARASAARMEYSLVKKRIVLVPGRGAPHVSLWQEGQHFTARELEYEFAEAGRLGRLWAAGPGELKAVQARSPVEQTVLARWEKELRIRPHEHNQVVSLVGDASVTVAPMGRFDARELHLWVREVPAAHSELRRLPPAPDAAVGSLTKPEQPKFTLLPDRLLAAGSVRLTSVQLDAEAARLEAWFRHLPVEQQTPLPEMPPIGNGSGIAPASLLQPQGANSEMRGVVPIPKPLSPQKFHVNGELVQLQVVVQGKKLDLEDLLIRTHAVIEEIRTEEPGQESILIRGDSIELRHGTTAEAKIDVVGQPAEVKGRGMSLAGNMVQVLRGENTIRIEGPGEASLPMPDEQMLTLTPGATAPPVAAGPVREPRPAPRPAAGLPPTPAEKMHLVWQQGLNFDGLTARLAGGVEIRTATPTASQVVLAQSLDATLTEPLDFMETEKRPAVELGRLLLDGGVLVKNYGYNEDGQKISFDQLKVKNLTLDRAQGTMHADGPGWGHTVRKTEGGLPGLPGARPPLPTGAAGNVQPGNAAAALTSIHVSFERAIDGELAKRTITFKNNVRTTYSPANSFDDQIIAERPSDLDVSGILMTSDALTVTEMLLPDVRWMEMQATGNALVEGASFTARAAKIGYTSDKEVLTVEGDGRADAQIWYQAAPGQPRSYTSARKFRYWLRDGTFDGEDFSVLDLQQLGNLKFGGARR